MGNAFDPASFTYDTDFVHSEVGRLQRKRVWDYLDKYMQKKAGLDILELGCGTGEDAVWMASMGHIVLATDVSEGMIDAAISKSEISKVKGDISFAKLDIADVDAYPRSTRFDMVFSNFGAFNCISPGDFGSALVKTAGLLNDRGRFIIVMMSRYCLWERFYFMIKRDFQEGKRRSNRGPVKASLGDATVDTWYYSPSEVKKIAAKDFNVRKIMPVGLFLPPSYLDSYFSKHKRFLHFLNFLEGLFGRFGPFSGIADHFLIDLEVRR